MIDVNDDNFETEVLNSAVPVFIDFYAEWCSPCRAVASKINELDSSYNSTVKFVKVNIDDSMDIPQKYGIRGIPSFVVIKEQKSVLAGILNAMEPIEVLKEKIDKVI